MSYDDWFDHIREEMEAEGDPTMTETPNHTCPRRIEDGRAEPNGPLRDSGTDLDTWDVREYPDSPGIINNGRLCCSYCGSLHPDAFMEAAESGVELVPTDKSYKVYLRWAGSPSQGKFYFQHLTIEQRQRFLDLYIAGTLRIGVPGHFYVLPFFI